MRQCVRRLVLMIVVLLALGATAEAVLVEIDMDPGNPGTQANLSPILMGDMFTVDILVSGITAPLLQGFQFNLNFDAAVLSATSLVSGGYLPVPIFAFPPAISPGAVSYFELHTGLDDTTGGMGAGTLASITFDALATDFSPLAFNGVLFTAFNSVPIPIDEGVHDGSVNFVPIPGAALLFGTGLIGLIAIARRKALGTQK